MELKKKNKKKLASVRVSTRTRPQKWKEPLEIMPQLESANSKIILKSAVIQNKVICQRLYYLL
jgi:hypothetical protein